MRTVMKIISQFKTLKWLHFLFVKYIFFFFFSFDVVVKCDQAIFLYDIHPNLQISYNNLCYDCLKTDLRFFSRAS